MKKPTRNANCRKDNSGLLYFRTAPSHKQFFKAKCALLKLDMQDVFRSFVYHWISLPPRVQLRAIAAPEAIARMNRSKAHTSRMGAKTIEAAAKLVKPEAVKAIALEDLGR